ncbi:DegT/DnrJ/EryC1/StrS family aminotransferase [Membranihabitans maritimus]|uniref:DegT/DnrJ/EryC1/StrS family aminotransferase n=1 Tax=Membranihabitans maritimus TaxID=2904244 RepID=UPI001F296FE4|nr:DegT/DnrJ/EryC1/StrS family aminotransferase [Membranihabitans maritimus]
MKKKISRRNFVKYNSVAGLGTAAGLQITGDVFNIGKNSSSTPAILGGTPSMGHDWPDWPIWKPQIDEERVIEVIRSGVWSRAAVVKEFEEKWAETLGVKRCLTVVNGTNALNAALAQYEIGWGDEVLVTPYTFIASVSCILFNGAIPVFVDVDPETFQMDPAKIEEKITSNTAAILPVHILGLPCDMDPIMKIAKKHKLKVIEDACQGWLAEYDNKKLGTIGDAGCFSFQNSKNLPMGEGGAIVSNDDEFMDRCTSFHNYGNPYGSVSGEVGAGTIRIGTKLRITEYQAAIGLAQLKRLEDQTELRSKNAELLKGKIKDVPGILPYRLYDKTNRAAFHLFPFRYKEEEFKGLSRSKFLEALRAEGVPCSSGYRPLNKMPYLENAFNSKFYKKFYPSERLDYDSYAEVNECPLNDQLCDEAVWFTQNLLLGSKEDMNNIANAIEKIYKNAEKIK